MNDRLNFITDYFDLSPEQKKQFEQMGEVYQFRNNQINVVSRKDIDELYIRHILHSLAIAKVIRFKPASAIVDVGCGGGFPGIPLAILMPEVSFTLIDSIGKKIKVVNEVAQALNAINVTGICERSEKFKGKFDFVVSRAVTAFPDFVKQTRHLVSNRQNNALPNGILNLKGGEFNDELIPFAKHSEVFNISDFFDHPFFETKKVIYLPIV
jgi:16S rRNA (guanine527-N7)-methyltransferase